MDDVTKQALLSVARTIVGVGGGALVAHGYLNDATANQLIGAVMTLIPLCWGIWEKYSSEKKTQARVTEAYNAGSSQMPMPTPTKESKP